MAIFNAIKLLSMLLTIVSARLYSRRSMKNNNLIDHRQLQPGRKTNQESKRPKQSEQNKGLTKSIKATKKPKGNGSVSGPSVFCSVLPALSASAPSGAKLFLYGKCDQLDQFPVPPNGVVSYGKCDIYTKSSRAAESYLGTMRYHLDAGTTTTYNSFQYML